MGGKLRRDSDNGKRSRQYVYAKTRVECAAKLREALDAREQGFVHDGTTTVAQYLQIWLKSRRADLRPTTFDAYSTYIEHYVVPYVGSIKLTALRPQHIDQMLTELEAKGFKPSTRQKARIMLRQAMEHALRRRLVRETLSSPPTIQTLPSP